ncbi:YuzD family protein [Halobacillus seohaensis]|uniref:YuzD family protein n=1 Tax=Halobacillus seohaensis TaxID=447421 RepID=A0ABW2ENW9_9BACI
MPEKHVLLTVYGAEVRCASCVNAPGSKETYEWLQAAISRKYHVEFLSFRYVDIYDTIDNEKDQEYINQIMNDELFYPLVLVNEEIAGEGNPRLKAIYKALENEGIELKEDSNV